MSGMIAYSPKFHGNQYVDANGTRRSRKSASPKRRRSARKSPTKKRRSARKSPTKRRVSARRSPVRKVSGGKRMFYGNKYINADGTRKM